jgi:hypothetical protein
MGDEEEGGPKPNHANIDDEFLKHPHSGAQFRNPLLAKDRSQPILLQRGEFDFNCLEDAFVKEEWHCIKVSESSYQALMRNTPPKTPPTPAHPRSPLARAALNRLRDLPVGYEFALLVRKTTWVAPRGNRRRREEAKVSATGVVVDKINIEVTEGAQTLRVEAVREGLVSTWNQTNPAFMMKPGDEIVKVNNVRIDTAAMIQEMKDASDQVRLIVRRPPSKTDSRGSNHRAMEGMEPR